MQTRPTPGLRGAAYYAEMRRLCAELREDVLADTALLWSEQRKLTPRCILRLALWHALTPAAVAWILEDLGILPAGVYDSLKARGWRPMRELERMRNELSARG